MVINCQKTLRDAQKRVKLPLKNVSAIQNQRGLTGRPYKRTGRLSVFRLFSISETHNQHSHTNGSSEVAIHK